MSVTHTSRSIRFTAAWECLFPSQQLLKISQDNCNNKWKRQLVYWQTAAFLSVNPNEINEVANKSTKSIAKRNSNRYTLKI